MNNKMLSVSLLINLLFIVALMVLVYQLGGWNYLLYRVKNRGLAEVYQHRSEMLENLPLSSSDIIFLGNSLTQYGEWTELLQNPNIKNRGIAGDGVEGVLKRLPAILQSRPQAVFLMIGVNDLFFHDIDFIIQHYEDLLRKCASESPGTKFFIQSVLPVNGDIKAIPIRNSTINELNERIRKLSIQFQMPYIDLHAKFCDTDGQLNTDFSVDGIHLNGRGYALWAKELQPYLNEVAKTDIER